MATFWPSRQRKRRCRTAASPAAVFAAGLMVLALGISGAARAQRAPVPEAGEEALLDDMEGDIAARWGDGLVADRAYFKGGGQAGLWVGLQDGKALETQPTPNDWRRYDELVFWCRAAHARGMGVVIEADSRGRRRARQQIAIDWDGWREIRVALNGFGEVNWEEVLRLRLRPVDSLPVPAEARLWFDEIRLAVAPLDPDRPRPEGLLCDFEVDDLPLWDGLEPDAERFTAGRQSGLWADPAANDNRGFVPPITDWTPYEYIEFDAYSELANDDEFIFTVFSDNAETEGPDYWSYIVPVDWEEWKHFKIRFRRMFRMRQPRGWDQITSIRLFGRGWGMPEYPETVVSFDNMRLTPGPGHQMAEGVIDDFEEGPYAWWGGMSEGRIPAKTGEGCGRLRIGATHVGFDPPLKDWRGYTKITAWVHATGLGGRPFPLPLGTSGAPRPPPPDPSVVEGEWQRVEWPLAAGVDATAYQSVRRMYFAVRPPEGVEIHIDDLRLER